MHAGDSVDIDDARNVTVVVRVTTAHVYHHTTRSTTYSNSYPNSFRLVFSERYVIINASLLRSHIRL